MPLNLTQISKAFNLDMDQLSAYLRLISTTFSLFTMINKAENLSTVAKMFSPVTKPKSVLPETVADANGYHISLGDFKIITDLYYICSLRPLPLDIVNANAIYKSILERYPRFFRITDDMLQLTLCAKFFTEEFLRCKKIKVEMPRSIIYEENGKRFSLILE